MPWGAIPLVVLGLPFLASVLILLWARNRRQRTTWMMTGTAVLCVLLSAPLFGQIAHGGVVRMRLPWLPALGLEMTLRVDGLAWLFLMLVGGIGALVGLYASYYMPRDYPLVRFFSLLLAFMGSMLGIVVAGNVIQLVFFWELTSLFSFLLIGYWRQGESARDAARTALIVTGLGGLCLFAGVMLLGHVAGSYDLDAILASGDAIRNSSLYLPALGLIVIGALSKSAQFPFHFWLPQAMSAPTPVSAYLHSATLVKAGVFVLLRFWPVLAGTEPWFWLVGGAGLASLLLGAWSATFQQDLKAILAWSTISHLGLITMLLGLGGTLGAVAAIFHIVNHATFKASLFMAVGAVDNETGSRDLRRLGGLWRVMPITATLAVIAGAAMAGVPLLNGFLSKEMFFSVALGTHHGPVVDALVVAIAVGAAALGVTYSLRLLWGAFFGPSRHDYPRTPHEPPRWMRFPIAFLALACLAVGMFPARVIGAFLHAAAYAVLGAETPTYNLAIWHGWSLPMLASLVAFACGCALYFVLRRRYRHVLATPILRHFSASQAFEHTLVFMTGRLPEWAQRRFPARRLQTQLRIVVVLALLVGSAGMGAWWLRLPAAGGTPVDPAFALLWLLGAACAVGAARLAKFQRMAALILVGGAGLAVCITFVWLSAPDLALTQLLVEAVTTILILLGLRWLPKRVAGLAPDDRLAGVRRWRDAVIAIAAGLGVGGLAYAVMLHPVSHSVSQFFLREALPAGGGHNVVNVILVDFRGFDTLGEITVLAIVAISVFALLRRFRPAAESLGMPAPQRRAPQGIPVMNAVNSAWQVPDYRAIPARLVLLLTPFIVLFALHLFVRGHDLPGGGFAAGIALTLGLIALYMVRGARWVEARLRVAPTRWIALGLLLACATGAAALWFGAPFLTSWTAHPELPLLGRITLSTAMLFDLGVFAVVVGASSLILVALAHLSLRRSLAARDGAADTEPTH